MANISNVQSRLNLSRSDGHWFHLVSQLWRICELVKIYVQIHKSKLFLLWHLSQWIGLRENLQESPIFNGKIYGFL